MSLVTEIFPKFYGGTFVEEISPKVTQLVGDAATVVTSPAVKGLDNLTRIDEQTGEPIGALAVMKELFLRRVAKSLRPYRRMSFA